MTGRLGLAQLLGWWSWRPWVLLGLTAASATYARGVTRLWANAGTGHGIRRLSVAAYGAGMAALVVALVSPLDPLSALLFSAHMSQHELLMLVAAPLIVMGHPVVALLWAVPPRARERLLRAGKQPAAHAVWRAATHPTVALVVHAVVLWAWHVPFLFEAAMRSEPLHAVQHLMFFATAALFWWSLLAGRYGRAGYGVAVLFVFATGLHTGLLGVLLTFARHPWYPIYDARVRGLGGDPLSDQTLAGLIMWIPAGAILFVFGLALLAAWVAEAERRARRAEAPPNATRREDRAPA
ncbi:MAG TPA: cytochrome c oxidase assembly protein [Polyangia bacterium]|nr:cytochrome c oxidase assembly protein [Polyangia bacterium]